MKPKFQKFRNLQVLQENELSKVKGGGQEEEEYIIIYINGKPYRIRLINGKVVSSSEVVQQ